MNRRTRRDHAASPAAVVGNAERGGGAGEAGGGDLDGVGGAQGDGLAPHQGRHTGQRYVERHDTKVGGARQIEFVVLERTPVTGASSTTSETEACCVTF